MSITVVPAELDSEVAPTRIDAEIDLTDSRQGERVIDELEETIEEHKPKVMGFIKDNPFLSGVVVGFLAYRLLRR